MIKFGPAGTADSFKKMGYKDSVQLPEYLGRFGLNAFEYQCGRGVNVSDEKAVAVGEALAGGGITVSLHAPYFISLSSVEEEKRLKSVDYILASARAVRLMGGNRIVVHSGSCSKISRIEALEKAKDTLKIAAEALKSEGLSDIHICPETMGKINQLGDLYEVMELSLVDDSFIPCIDFGHLNARTLGGIKTAADYMAIIDEIGNKLGCDRMKSFHSHFSKIEYSAGGEVRHLTFADDVFGPDPDALMEVIYKKGLEPTFICESSGTQTEDAEYLKNAFFANSIR